MPRPTTSNGRPRAIAVPRAGVPRRALAAWGALGVLGMLWLLLAGPVRAGSPHAQAAVVDVATHDPAHRFVTPHDTDRPDMADAADEAQTFTRPVDRVRRTAGRAGVPVRRDLRVGHAWWTPDAVLDRIPTGGPAPFGTPATITPPHRGTTVHGVRGPPHLVSRAG